MPERTSKSVASKAGKVLATSSSKAAKRAAASALVQAHHGMTSPKAARAASKVVGDRRFSPAARAAAGSALTQAPNRGRKK